MFLGLFLSPHASQDQNYNTAKYDLCTFILIISTTTKKEMDIKFIAKYFSYVSAVCLNLRQSLLVHQATQLKTGLNRLDSVEMMKITCYTLQGDPALKCLEVILQSQ